MIEIKGLWREFVAGDETFAALEDIHLSIAAGEMVAIVGASGSGKSTLMNILGCLDRPTRGEYSVAGISTTTLNGDELAQLRRQRFGFIFQRYHLLSHLSAVGNVEIPAIYAGIGRVERHARAAELLARLGLSERLHHLPRQLSGGQQQRVSIARALMNGGDIVLADEPTGALDRRSGEAVLRILRELHAQGSTIILVTHDRSIAERADRIIEVVDGRIVSDQRVDKLAHKLTPLRAGERLLAPRYAELLREAFRIALVAMRAHQLRTFLTMLGIMIGVASVVGVVAVGEGARQKVLSEISNLGTNTVEIWAGRGWGDSRSNRRAGLQPEDAEVLSEQTYVAAASPKVRVTLNTRSGGIEAEAEVTGVSEEYFSVMGIGLEQGRMFTGESVQHRAQEVVLDQLAKQTLFPDGADPVGKVILLGALPVRVIGVATDSPTIDNSDAMVIFAPYTTVRGRIADGRSRIRSLIFRVADGFSPGASEQAATQLLAVRRGQSDVYVRNSDAVRRTTEATARAMSLLTSTIALIALTVGGIGVMNIMLVSVTERTSEIGVRMAVGAPRRDILAQFLIEAVLVCMFGGVLGVALALLVGPLIESLTESFDLVYSMQGIAVAFLSSTIIGLIFGYLPARNAANLDPVQALTSN